MDDLIAFLCGQFDRDEQSARAMTHAVGGVQSRWDPSRLLAEVDAKRRIVGLHFVRSGTGGTWDTDPPAMCNEDNDLHPCGTLRCLTLPYAGHHDYLEKWRP